MKLLSIFLAFLLILSVRSGIHAAKHCLEQCARSWVFPVCYSACLASKIMLCFSEETFVMTTTGLKQITQLSIGEEVLTMNQKNQSQWTHIVKKSTHQADEFIRIQTNSTLLQVTPDHVIITGDKILRAKDLKIGMLIHDQKIEKLSATKKQRKVTLATKTGTIIANGLLTTTICGQYVDMNLDVVQALTKWRSDHTNTIQEQ